MSPLIALIQTLLPVLYGVIVLREQLQLHHWAGIALAMLAAWMISGARLAATRIPARSVLLAIMAGSMFATSLIFLDSSPAESGMTPGFVEMVLGMLLLGLLAIGASRHRRVFALTSRVDPQPPTTPTAPVPDLRVTVTALGAGLIMGTASILVLLALRTGPLALVTAISALYPLSTVALAAVVLRESVRPGQAVGIVLAVSACVLLSL